MQSFAAAVEVATPPTQETWPAAPPSLAYRVGHGFDLHRLEEGPYKLILGGIEIPHDRGCVAHSDGGDPIPVLPRLRQECSGCSGLQSVSAS